MVMAILPLNHLVCLGVCVAVQQANQQTLRKSGFLGGINCFHQGSIERWSCSLHGHDAAQPASVDLIMSRALYLDRPGRIHTYPGSCITPEHVIDLVAVQENTSGSPTICVAMES